MFDFFDMQFNINKLTFLQTSTNFQNKIKINWGINYKYSMSSIHKITRTYRIDLFVAITCFIKVFLKQLLLHTKRIIRKVFLVGCIKVVSITVFDNFNALRSKISLLLQKKFENFMFPQLCPSHAVSSTSKSFSAVMKLVQ